MTSMFIQAVYNDDEHCWIVTCAHGSPVPLECFQKGVRGVGETLEQAIGDWKEAMVLASLHAAS